MACPVLFRIDPSAAVITVDDAGMPPVTDHCLVDFFFEFLFIQSMVGNLEVPDAEDNDDNNQDEDNHLRTPSGVFSYFTANLRRRQ